MSNILELGPRPPCQNCGNPNPQSKAYMWLCQKCGRSWVKIPRPKVKVIDPTRPPCPNCGVNKTISNGSKLWLCESCGKQWVKHKHPRQVKDELATQIDPDSFKRIMEEEK